MDGVWGSGHLAGWLHVFGLVEGIGGGNRFRAGTSVRFQGKMTCGGSS